MRWALPRIAALALALPGLAACEGEEEPAPPAAAPGAAPRRVLPSALAGTWYDADPARLRAEIQAFLAAAEGEADDEVCALIQPHAGYRWSGATAAWGLRRVAGRRFARVVVLGPSHRLPLENVVSLPDATHYGTPLGEVPLDTAFLEALAAHPEFQVVPRAHDGEHSVQIQVPFLQVALEGFRLVPLVVGDLDRQTARRVADVLLGLIDPGTLVVASSDFTHYGPRFRYVPFTRDVPQRLRDLDLGAYGAIAEIDADAFVRYVEETRATICGRRPVEVLLRMLPREAEAALLRYETSGGLTGDYRDSVSYLSVSFRATWPTREAVAVPDSEHALSEGDRRALFRLARAAVEHAVRGQEAPAPEALGVTLTPALEQPRGAFVTLRRDGRLRGCIGEVYPSRPLYRAVIATATGAALHDRRFLPVHPDEFPHLEIQVSVLTPPSPVASWRDIVLGRHGIVLRKEGHTAIYLPEVAGEQGWDLVETLTNLATKAGLPPEAWREDAELLVFESQVFGDPGE